MLRDTRIPWELQFPETCSFYNVKDRNYVKKVLNYEALDKA